MSITATTVTRAGGLLPSRDRADVRSRRAAVLPRVGQGPLRGELRVVRCLRSFGASGARGPDSARAGDDIIRLDEFNDPVELPQVERGVGQIEAVLDRELALLPPPAQFFSPLE